MTLERESFYRAPRSGIPSLQSQVYRNGRRDRAMTDDDTPRLGGDEFDQLTIREVRVFPDVSGDERMYATLREAIDAMTAGGPKADEIYHETLHRRQEDEEFVVLVLKTLDALEESDYLERWALVQLAIDLEHPVAAGYLLGLVLRPVPPEQSEDPAHGISTVTEEVILRTTAVEGLARLFRRGFDSSDGLLELIATSEYVALKRSAWFALSENAGEGAVARARSLLDERGDGWITELRRIPVQEAKQQDPRLIDPNRPPRENIPAPYDE